MLVFQIIGVVEQVFQMISHNALGLFVFCISVFFSDTIFQNSESLFNNIGTQKIVYPKVLTRKETETRYKRWTNEQIDSGSLYIIINRWTLKTNFNDDLLISPNYYSQWVYSSEISRKKYNNEDYNNKILHKCLPLKGTIKEVNNSHVLLTLCDNDIFGLLNMSSKAFFLQPDIGKRHILYETTIPYKLTLLMNKYKRYFKKSYENQNYGSKVENYKRTRRYTKKFNNTFKSYNTERPYRQTYDCFDLKRPKRALTICDTAEYYNMSRDTASFDYIQYVGAMDGVKPDEEFAKNSRYYYTSQQPVYGRQRADLTLRQMSPFRPLHRKDYRWVKIVVGVDYDVIRFHGRRTEQYIFTVFNIISVLFKAISSTFVLRIVIMKILLYPDMQNSAVYAGDLKYPLYSVNKWNRELWHRSHEKHDMAVWYTHFQISEEVSTAPGAYMCHPEWSCLLIEDVGWLSAVKIAHGIGHLMGLTHDGDLPSNNNCAEETLLHTTIMAEVIPAIMPNPIWSSCSKSEYEAAFRKYSCLERPPLNHQHTEFTYGVFSLDEQCRIEFGEGWVYCSRISVQDPCKELWCNENVGQRRSCMTRQTRTLEGTLCGRGKRCINQTCEDSTRPGYVEGSTSQRPHPPFTSTLYPVSVFGYPEATTHPYPPPNYPAYNTYAPPGYPGINTNIPPFYPTTDAYIPPGYPGTGIYTPPTYPGPNTSKPPGYPPSYPPGYPGSDMHTTSRRPGTNINQPPTYPSSTYIPPIYPPSTNFPSSHPPSTDTPTGYPEIDIQTTSRRPGTNVTKPSNYSTTSTNTSFDDSGKPGNNVPGNPTITQSGTSDDYDRITTSSGQQSITGPSGSYTSGSAEISSFYDRVPSRTPSRPQPLLSSRYPS